MRTAFFLEDAFRGYVQNSSTYKVVSGSTNNKENVSDSRPRVAWMAGWTDPTDAETRFEVDNNNRYIDVTGASGTVLLTIPRGRYTGPELASKIQAAFSGSTYSLWTCSYAATSGQFAMTGTPDVSLLWKTGSHGSDSDNKSLVREVGFVDPEGTVTDSASAGLHVAPYPRWNTHTWLKINTSAVTPVPNLRAWMCEVANQELGAPDTTIDVSDIKIYGSSSDLGMDLYNWQLSASDDLTFSGSPELNENQIRVAYKTGGAASTSDNWFFSWRHQDSHKTHTVKLCKAFERTWSDSGRTLSTLAGHGLVLSGQPLGVDNYYPVQRLRRWLAPLAFDAWPASEYREVVQGVAHHGRQDALLWALRWDDIVDGTVDAAQDANDGLLLWATLQDYSRDTYIGTGADYISGDITIEQLR